MATPARSPSTFTVLTVVLAVAGAVALLLTQPPTGDVAPARSPSASPSAQPRPRPQPPPPPPASADARAPSAQPRRICTIAALGDSLTDARSGGGKYLQVLARRCPQSRLLNFGKGADMVNQMRRRMARDVIPPAPRLTHLIVFGGVNDLYSDLTAGRTKEKIARDLTWIYSQAQARGWEVVAVTVSPWGGFKRYYNERRGRATLELNQWITAQRRSGVVDHVVDSYARLSCGDPERLCPEYAQPYRDGIHFGPAGHARLGEALYEEAFTDCL